MNTKKILESCKQLAQGEILLAVLNGQIDPSLLDNPLFALGVELGILVSKQRLLETQQSIQNLKSKYALN